MRFKVHSIHFDADAKLVDFVNEKTEKLDQVFDKIIDGEVFLRLDKADSANNKIAEIKLRVPGKEFFAKKQCKTFEEATDTAVEAMQRQLKKHKGKSRNK